MNRRSHLSIRSFRFWLALCVLTLLPLTAFSGKAANAATSLDWTTRASMPTARMGIATAVTSDGTVYAIGGSTTGYNQSGGRLNTVEAYNPALNIGLTH